jgi:hypothetical protein
MGKGIYGEDHVLDGLDPLRDDLIRRIVFGLSDEAFLGEPPLYGAAIAAADVLALWCEYTDTYTCLPKTAIQNWRKRCLELFDADQDWEKQLSADKLVSREDARKMIEQLFDRLESASWD